MVKELKPGVPAFEVVEGDFKGHAYHHGVSYTDKEIPPLQKDKFTAVKDRPAAKRQPAKTAKNTAKESEKSA